MSTLDSRWKTQNEIDFYGQTVLISFLTENFLLIRDQRSGTNHKRGFYHRPRQRNRELWCDPCPKSRSFNQFFCLPLKPLNTRRPPTLLFPIELPDCTCSQDCVGEHRLTSTSLTCTCSDWRHWNGAEKPFLPLVYLNQWILKINMTNSDDQTCLSSFFIE